MRRGAQGAGWPAPPTNPAISITYGHIEIELCTTILCQFNHALCTTYPNPTTLWGEVRFDARSGHLIGLIGC
jgi:hypothetical protein